MSRHTGGQIVIGNRLLERKTSANLQHSLKWSRVDAEDNNRAHSVGKASCSSLAWEGE